jgi:transcriptional regulator with XRE-family HTH domain
MLTTRQEARILKGMKPLSQMLTDWRNELTLTKAQAARRCQMSFAHWSLLESGERTQLQAATMQKLAAGTGIPTERLLAAANFHPDPVRSV